MATNKLSWTDVEDLALRLLEVHPSVDPLTVRFTQLKQMVQALPDFEEKAGHPVNEKILETIQATWYEEKQDADDAEEDDNEK